MTSKLPCMIIWSILPSSIFWIYKVLLSLSAKFGLFILLRLFPKLFWRYLNKKKTAEEMEQHYQHSSSVDYSLKEGETLVLQIKNNVCKSSFSVMHEVLFSSVVISILSYLLHAEKWRQCEVQVFWAESKQPLRRKEWEKRICTVY